MILIWSNEGGPLQFIGLAIFFLQFFVPQIFQLTVNIQDLATVDGTPHAFAQIVSCLAFAIIAGGLWFAWIWNALPDDTDTADNNNVETANVVAAPAPSGSAANPVVIDDNEDDSFWTRARNRISNLVQSYESFTLSPTQMMLAAGIILPLAMTFPLLMNGLQKGGLEQLLADSGVVQITILAVIAHSLMAVAAYRVLRDVLDGGTLGVYPGNRRGGIGLRRRARKLTVAEIADIVRKVSVEEFVSEEHVKVGECSIARMKRMLVNRGESEVAETCVERKDLVKEVERVRNYNAECAICAEDYAEGDVLRITHCKHEFHLHCFDKWIYTFATDSRPATHPTCPLCKAVIS